MQASDTVCKSLVWALSQVNPYYFTKLDLNLDVSRSFYATMEYNMIHSSSFVNVKTKRKKSLKRGLCVVRLCNLVEKRVVRKMFTKLIVTRASPGSSLVLSNKCYFQKLYIDLERSDFFSIFFKIEILKSLQCQSLIQCPKSAIRTEIFPWASNISTEFTTGSTSMSGTWTKAGKDSPYLSNCAHNSPI